MKNAKSRNFNLVLYPEDNTHRNALEIIKRKYNHAYILHDKDYDENGELKKPHYHVVITFPNARYQLSIASELQIDANYLEKTSSLESSLLYLIHYNESDKYPYDINEVKGTLLTKLNNLINSNGYDEGLIIQVIIEYIDNQDYITIRDFMLWTSINGYYPTYRRSQYNINALIKEHNTNLQGGTYEK